MKKIYKRSYLLIILVLTFLLVSCQSIEVEKSPTPQVEISSTPEAVVSSTPEVMVSPTPQIEGSPTPSSLNSCAEIWNNLPSGIKSEGETGKYMNIKSVPDITISLNDKDLEGVFDKQSTACMPENVIVVDSQVLTLKIFSANLLESELVYIGYLPDMTPSEELIIEPVYNSDKLQYEYQASIVLPKGKISNLRFSLSPVLEINAGSIDIRDQSIIGSIAFYYADGK